MAAALLISAIIFWILPIWVGHQIGKPKGRAGGLWGFFLGWIGVIIVALLPSKLLAPTLRGAAPSLPGGSLYRECPHCKEPMRRDASICPHCRSESPSWRLHDGRWWVRATESGAWHWLNERTNEWVRVEEPKEVSPSAPPA